MYRAVSSKYLEELRREILKVVLEFNKTSNKLIFEESLKVLAKTHIDRGGTIDGFREVYIELGISQAQEDKDNALDVYFSEYIWPEYNIEQSPIDKPQRKRSRPWYLYYYILYKTDQLQGIKSTDEIPPTKWFYWSRKRGFKNRTIYTTKSRFSIIDLQKGRYNEDIEEVKKLLSDNEVALNWLETKQASNFTTF